MTQKYLAGKNEDIIVAVDGYSIRIYYLGQMCFYKPKAALSDPQPSIDPPYAPDGWEDELLSAISSLRDPKHTIGNLINYLPSGTLVNLASNEFPTRVGLGPNVNALDDVVIAIGLWLNRKLGTPLEKITNTNKK